ncbi:serine/threonine protein kinase [Thecamonas trahens ATCC 50062]|uniref:Serine/threonine protein kinase n=1 Tax=Thecamonas trahens ATCC 50062 TaxID=461836 RepID=A0A0L0D6P3_THETB|nr:serine/threonine protein kinase [Thecamonas trahens ATCC 50062]KNC47751.1 serine/threonine protein kinase [Thecamonas trahens ATCC 50062]|eukprot:XP_013759229.1 serine/threonine protein kinase [Thecamonas trahens ATCC 50062]
MAADQGGEALNYIRGFDRFILPDDTPNVEGPNFPISYGSASSYNFADREGYQTDFVDEAGTMARIDSMLERGTGFIALLYTYRSCSKSVPQVKSQDQENKVELYQNTFRVLEPQINKLKNLFSFVNECIDFLLEEFEKLAADSVGGKKSSGRTTSSSDTLIWKLVLLLDLLSKLDALKNMKGCNNDLSFYKRAYGFLRKNLEASGLTDQTLDNQEMYLFLANQNIITNTLKQKLPQVSRYTTVLVLILEHCLQRWTGNLFLYPEEKHALLRVIPFSIFLYDSQDPAAPNNAFKTKEFKVLDYARLLKRYPVLPLYGDMAMLSSSFIERCSNFDPKVWEKPYENERLNIEYCIINRLPVFRSLHDEYLADFSARITEVRRILRAGKMVSQKIARLLYGLILKGFRILSNMTSAVLEQAAWKFSNPYGDTPADRNPDDVIQYERVVRYNYDSRERYCLVEVIAKIKGLSQVMLRADSLLMEMMRRRVHDEMQQFVQSSLRDLVFHATKKKKLIRASLMQMRAMAADWLNGQEPKDPMVDGKKVTKKNPFKLQIPSRCAGPSPTQLQLLRCIISSLYSGDRKGKSKDLKPDHVALLKSFYERSFFYSYVLDFQGTLRGVTDLAMLWYREFYLELADADQFPIEMSLPWILADHILQTYAQNPAMVEFVLYPLDLYNDAAEVALRTLRQQFMYNEVEAEVNLVFDQLVYKLSETYFNHVKVQAASRLLDQEYRARLASTLPPGRLDIPRSRFEVLLRQRHCQLLGRSIDLSALVSQRMNYALRENLDYAITKFEAEPFSGIIELLESIKNVREMHRIMSINVTLDPFEVMLNDTADSSSLVSFHGRIILHAVFELINDVVPNMMYSSTTERFVRAPVQFGEDVERVPMPKIPPTHQFGTRTLNNAYATVFMRTKSFVGIPHFRALFDIVGIDRMGLVIAELVGHIRRQLENKAAPYITTLLDGMPEQTTLPRHSYGTAGVIGFFEAKLDPIVNYDGIQEVFQAFREIGNSLAIFTILDSLAHERATLGFTRLAPFVDASPLTNFGFNDEHLASTIAGIRSTIEATINTSLFSELPQDAIAAVRLYQFELNNASLTRYVLLDMAKGIDPHRNEWMGPPSENGLVSVDTSYELYRLWSALQFTFCLPPRGDAKFAPMDIFGDGFCFGGLALVYLMEQADLFNALDFAYHALNVDEASEAKASDEPSRYLLSRAAYVRSVNDGVLGMLRATAPLNTKVARDISPPADDSASFR